MSHICFLVLCHPWPRLFVYVDTASICSIIVGEDGEAFLYWSWVVVGRQLSRAYIFGYIYKFRTHTLHRLLNVLLVPCPKVA